MLSDFYAPKINQINSYQLVAAAENDSVSLDDVKTFLRIDTDDDDTILASLIAAATSWLETNYNICLITQTWDLFLEYPNRTFITIRKRPLVSITSIVSFDTNGDEQAFSADNYFLHNDKVVLKNNCSWPTSYQNVKGMKIRFVAGYTAANVVPHNMRLALYNIIAQMYENRDTTPDYAHAKMLLQQYKGVRL